MSTDANDVARPSSKRPGRGGDRGGRRPAGPWSGKPLQDAIKRATKDRDPITGKRNIELIARRLVRNAIHGDDAASNAAIREIGDRLDGKVHGNDQAHAVSVSFVVRMPSPASEHDWAREVRATVEATDAPAIQHQPNQPTTVQQGRTAGDQFPALPRVGAANPNEKHSHPVGPGDRSHSQPPNVVDLEAWPGNRLGGGLRGKRGEPVDE